MALAAQTRQTQAVIPLLVVAAYNGVSPVVERHMPYWKASECEVLIVSPSDEPCPQAGLIVGHTDHSGPAAIARMVDTFKAVAKTGYEAFIFGEYDLVTFKPPPPIPDDDTIRAPLHRNLQSSYSASIYPHPPLVMHRRGLSRLLEAIERLKPDLNAQSGFGDRWLGAIIQDAGITLEPQPGAYSQNSIDRPEFVAEARACLASGGWAVHGIKTAKQLAEVIA